VRPTAAVGDRDDLPRAGLLGALVFVGAHLPGLTNAHVVNDDVRQQLFWMQRWLDPELYPGDILADYARHYVPWGVQGVYWLASRAMSPLVFSKILPGLLFVGLGLALYGLGRTYGGRAAAWSTLALLWLDPFFLDRLAGGLARGFAAPLLALGWWGWASGRSRVIALALLLQSIFIPYAAVLFGTALGLGWLWAKAQRRQAEPFPSRRWHFVVGAGAASMVGAFSHSFSAAGYGPLVGGLASPEFGPTGRFPLLPFGSPGYELLVEPWLWLAPFREGGFVCGVLAVLALGTVLFVGGRRVLAAASTGLAAPVVHMMAASLLLYALARTFPLSLFFASRYLEHTAHLLLVVALGASLGRLLPPLSRTAAAVCLLVVVLLGTARQHGVGLFDYSANVALYDRLQALPKDALIAGHPYVMDSALTFGRRRVLATFELAHPWAHGYWRWLRPRIEDVLRAYYAAEPSEVLLVSQRYGIDFWVVDERHFAPRFLDPPSPMVPLCQALHLPSFLDSRCHALGLPYRVLDRSRLPEGLPGPAPFFAPFDGLVRRMIGERTRFALLSETAWPGERLGSHLRLVDLRGRELPPTRETSDARPERQPSRGVAPHL